MSAENPDLSTMIVCCGELADLVTESTFPLIVAEWKRLGRPLDEEEVRAIVSR